MIHGETVNEMWQVRLPSGEVRAGTLDQLDEAWQAGHIDASTPVLAPGSTHWTTLGEAAGLDDEESDDRPMIPTPAPSLSSVVMDEADDELPAPRARRNPTAIALVATAALGIGVLAALASARGGAQPAYAPPAAAAPIAKDTPAPMQPAPAAEPRAAEPAPPEPAAKEESSPAPAHEARAAAQPRRGKAAPEKAEKPRKASRGSSPFTKGGDPHDPLNSAL